MNGFVKGLAVGFVAGVAAAVLSEEEGSPPEPSEANLPDELADRFEVYEPVDEDRISTEEINARRLRQAAVTVLAQAAGNPVLLRLLDDDEGYDVADSR